MSAEANVIPFRLDDKSSKDVDRVWFDMRRNDADYNKAPQHAEDGQMDKAYLI